MEELDGDRGLLIFPKLWDFIVIIEKFGFGDLEVVTLNWKHYGYDNVEVKLWGSKKMIRENNLASFSS